LIRLPLLITYCRFTLIILIYPFIYLEQQGVKRKIEKYNFWVLNTNMDGRVKDIVKEHIVIAKRKFIIEKFIREIVSRRLLKLLATLEK
jgi:hypothetical protein